MTEADTAPPDDAAIEAALLAIVGDRGLLASACPSEAARSLSAEHWRGLMPRVREAAVRLTMRQQLDITQDGQVLQPGAPLKGPIRIRLPRS